MAARALLACWMFARAAIVCRLLGLCGLRQLWALGAGLAVAASAQFTLAVCYLQAGIR